ncbi:MAG: MBL fold metallo-hydrolase [Promethearchaeota archaeon]|jgi:ribonuclease BN (tRNA processing enzyme)
MDDELVILGSGGGRHHIRTQYRATGGILFKFLDNQVHIDPGPGAIVRINQYKEDPTKTNLFIVTHMHIDHFNDLCAIIEASREQLHDRNYNYFKKGTLITTEEVLEFVPKYHQNMLETIVSFKPGETYNFRGATIVGTKVIHSQIEGFGVIFKLKDYSIAFTSDTKVFEGFSDQISGVDLLVLNLLRPDSITCRRHVCTDDVIPYLNKVTPPIKGLLITHFGSYMDSHFSPKNYVPSQVRKLRDETNIRTIVAAEDGSKIKISDLLGN